MRTYLLTYVTDVHNTSCEKIVITTGCYCGSASWIKNILGEKSIFQPCQISTRVNFQPFFILPRKSNIFCAIFCEVEEEEVEEEEALQIVSSLNVNEAQKIHDQIVIGRSDE